MSVLVIDVGTSGSARRSRGWRRGGARVELPTVSAVDPIPRPRRVRRFGDGRRGARGRHGVAAGGRSRWRPSASATSVRRRWCGIAAAANRSPLGSAGRTFARCSTASRRSPNTVWRWRPTSRPRRSPGCSTTSPARAIVISASAPSTLGWRGCCPWRGARHRPVERGRHRIADGRHHRVVGRGVRGARHPDGDAADRGRLDRSVRRGQRAAPARRPLAALIGDQQASLVGQGCVHPGLAKITFGTGGMLDVCTGTTAPTSHRRSSHGTFPIVAWSRGGQRTWGAEAIMLSAGTNVDWLRDDLGIIDTAAESHDVAAHCEHTDGVVYVPALMGLGTPHWDYGARGTLLGLTRGTAPTAVGARRTGRDRPSRGRSARGGRGGLRRAGRGYQGRRRDEPEPDVHPSPRQLDRPADRGVAAHRGHHCRRRLPCRPRGRCVGLVRRHRRGLASRKTSSSRRGNSIASSGRGPSSGPADGYQTFRHSTSRIAPLTPGKEGCGVSISKGFLRGHRCDGAGTARQRAATSPARHWTRRSGRVVAAVPGRQGRRDDAKHRHRPDGFLVCGPVDDCTAEATDGGRRHPARFRPVHRDRRLHAL